MKLQKMLVVMFCLFGSQLALGSALESAVAAEQNDGFQVHLGKRAKKRAKQAAVAAAQQAEAANAQAEVARAVAEQAVQAQAAAEKAVAIEEALTASAKGGVAAPKKETSDAFFAQHSDVIRPLILATLVTTGLVLGYKYLMPVKAKVWIAQQRRAMGDRWSNATRRLPATPTFEYK